jgi:hypothetical protein
MSYYTHAFLDALRATGVVSRACRVVGVSSAEIARRRKTDGDFDAAFENAMEDATDTLEGEARRRAVEGIEEPIVYQGSLSPVWERGEAGELILEPSSNGETRPVQARNEDGSLKWLTVRKFSDPMLMFLLKGNRVKYGTERTELTGKGGEPLTIDATARAARVAALLALAQNRKTSTNVDDLL